MNKHPWIVRRLREASSWNSIGGLSLAIATASQAGIFGPGGFLAIPSSIWYAWGLFALIVAFFRPEHGYDD